MTLARRFSRIAFALAIIAAVAGCAANPKNPADPLEPLNRVTHQFNETIDRFAVKPIAQGYNFILPQNFRNMIHNAFQNLLEPVTILNQLLQGKFQAAGEETFRFVVNSTFGFGGVADLATEIGFPRQREDFGQTLGVWGVPSGPYFVIPFLGPSDIRDTVGLVVDFVTLDAYFTIDNVSARNITIGTWYVDTRAHLLDTEQILDEAAVDKYAFIRDSYLQRRRSLIYDGSPPRQKYDDEENNDKPAADKRSDATEAAPESGAVAEAKPDAASEAPAVPATESNPIAETPAAAPATAAPAAQPASDAAPGAVPLSDAGDGAAGGLPPLAATPAPEPTAPRGAVMRVWLPASGLTH